MAKPVNLDEVHNLIDGLVKKGTCVTIRLVLRGQDSAICVELAEKTSVESAVSVVEILQELRFKK